MKTHQKISFFKFKWALILFSIVTLTLISSCSTSQHEQFGSYLTDLKILEKNKNNSSPYVVLISIDGFRHDYIKKYQPPFLSEIEKKGFRAKSLEPIFPSKTFPNHYSLITGLYSDQHKLVANRFYDPERKEAYLLGKPTTSDGTWYGGEPLWTSIKKQGLLTASYFWVGSDANIQNSYPSYYYPYNHGTPNTERTKQVLRWLEMPKEIRPHFITLYFSHVDSAGHRYGPNSDEVKEAVLNVDRLISNLAKETQKMNGDVNFVIVSDHGMKEIDPKKSIFIGDYLETNLVSFYEQGPLTLGYFNTMATLEQREVIIKKLQEIPGVKLYEKKDRPAHWHYSKLSRQGDFILVVENGAYLFPEKRPENFLGKSGGTHGYDPKISPEMNGIFLGFGPQIKKSGVVDQTKNINIYPFIMDLLNLKVQVPIDGSSEKIKNLIRK